jgi:type IV pilus assembly protein PilC
MSSRQLWSFYLRLGDLLRSGSTLRRALESVSRSSGAGPRRIAAAAMAAIDRGGRLSEGVAAGGAPELDAAVLRLFEETGALGDGCLVLADLYEYRLLVRDLWLRGLSSPLAALGVLLVALFGASWALYGPATAMRRLLYGTIGLGGLAALVLLVQTAASVRPVRLVLSRLALSAPLFGRVTLDLARARFTTFLAQLYASGQTAAVSVELAAAACGNLYLEGRLRKRAGELVGGGSLVAAIGGESIVDELGRETLLAAEEAGTLDTALSRLGQRYREEGRKVLERRLPLVARVLLIPPVILLFFLGLLDVVFALLGRVAAMLGEPLSKVHIPRP